LMDKLSFRCLVWSSRLAVLSNVAQRMATERGEIGETNRFNHS
jgi:hypothetical protein